MPTKYKLNDEQKARKALTDKILYANKKKAKKLEKINLEKPKNRSSEESDSDNEENLEVVQQKTQQKYTFY
jgi:hypothetical protein